MFENFDWINAMRNSPVMLIILACSVVTLGFALERLIYFARRRGHPDQILSAAIDRVRAGKIKDAGWLCESTRHPVGAVARQVIENMNLPADAVEEKMQIALSDQKLQLERHLGWLGTMGNTAPLIGLLGTVWGIMRAFHDMALTGSAGPSVVAAGIAEALFTTAAGLMVAVPAVMLYNYFIRQTHVMLTVAENHARSIRIAMEQAHGDAGHRGNASHAGSPPRTKPAMAAEAA
jgi:biopolymer transport protein ExbB